MKDEFSTFDVCKILDIPKGRLREWIILGFIHPSIQEAKGQGTKALFSFPDVCTIVIFQRLVEGGISRKSAAEGVFPFFSKPIQATSTFLLYNYYNDDGKLSMDSLKKWIESTSQNYFLFFSKEGIITTFSFIRPGVDSFLNVIATEDADLVIGVNFKKIVKDVLSKIERE